MTETLKCIITKKDDGDDGDGGYDDVNNDDDARMPRVQTPFVGERIPRSLVPAS